MRFLKFWNLFIFYQLTKIYKTMIHFYDKVSNTIIKNQFQFLFLIDRAF